MRNFDTHSTLKIQEEIFSFHSLPKFFKKIGRDPQTLPFSLKILIENLLRFQDKLSIHTKQIETLGHWNGKAIPEVEIPFMPARILLQDFTGVPTIADLAAMRSALYRLKGDPNQINPLQPVDLVIDHSVQVDYFGTKDAFNLNTSLEFERNAERYQFLKWGQETFKNFRVVPPNTGIVHQINLEYLAQVAITGSSLYDGETWIYPDTLIGTDSHTTMINGLGVLGWGVGGIEAEAALLGQPCSMLIPEVIGFRFYGKLPAGVTSTDLVLTVTQTLREKGVVGKFIEFIGPGIKTLSLADRATLANMAPEYGATIGLFPVDETTLQYLKSTARAETVIKRVETYYREQELWHSPEDTPPIYSETVDFNLSEVEPCLAGPSRPQDRVFLRNIPQSFQELLSKNPSPPPSEQEHGAIVIAAITSCTNTSNPNLLIAAGILAKKACEKGLQVKPWVKTSLAPGSKVVTDYLQKAGLTLYLEKLKFHLVGYGCTTCIGNSGPLSNTISKKITEEGLFAVSVLSGNRNFEGRVNSLVRANYLASPPLVVAYALAGNININLETTEIGKDPEGHSVFLKDIWPTSEEIEKLASACITPEQFRQSYSDIFSGEKNWKNLKIQKEPLYLWDPKSSYIKEPPFFHETTSEVPLVQDIMGARVLAFLGDSITTDHISPAGSIDISTPAGEYLKKLGIKPSEFNSYGARRGNHEVMVRGTFANPRLKNKLVPKIEGGVTKLFPEEKQVSIFEASEEYRMRKVPLIILAGKEYGTGSSRDWAAKGPKLLGVRAIIAESFERIHRSNLIGMGILPLEFLKNENAESLKLTGKETWNLTHLTKLTLRQKIQVHLCLEQKTIKVFTVLVRIDTHTELEYFKHGGILPYVLRQALKKPVSF